MGAAAGIRQTLINRKKNVPSASITVMAIPLSGLLRTGP
jgi:hypothetical protein